MSICGPFPCLTEALALIEISPTLLQAPLQGFSCLLPADASQLPPQGLSFSHFLGWPLP